MTQTILDHPASVIVIEDSALLGGEVIDLLVSAGFNSVGQFPTYEAALKAIDQLSPAFCVLDLDLGDQKHSGFGPGEEGRRLLCLLNAKNIGTVVYSGFTKMQRQLKQMHPTVLIVDKIEPTEHVIDALRELQESKQREREKTNSRNK